MDVRSCLVAAVVAAGCARSSSVNCGFGVCPNGTVCDDIHALCVTRAELDACASATGICRLGQKDQGLCDQGVCVPACGDGVRRGTEDCDDGNLANNDGCSATCTVENAVWAQWNQAWAGRRDHSAAFDSDRHVLVITGGVGPFGVTGDTWERTPDTATTLGQWHQAPAGPAVTRSAAAYDPVHHKLVLFGGADKSGIVNDETWEYDGTWTKRSPLAQPPARQGAAMVWDPSRSRVMMFGGSAADLSVFFNDTWEYDGTTWTQLFPTTSPTARHQAGIAWDAKRSLVVLHGGQNITSGGVLLDTWEYSGGQWTQGAAAPLRRFQMGMAYLPLTQDVLVFGGSDGLGRALDDLWEYDGTWKQVTLDSGPRGRRDLTLTLDPDSVIAATKGRLVAVGGTDQADDGVFDDAWEYPSKKVTSPPGYNYWDDITPSFEATARDLSAIAYDSARHVDVVMGGLSPGVTFQGDTWTFDGDHWQLLGAQPAMGAPQDPTLPDRRRRHAMAYDEARQRVVLFGGEGVSAELSDTWEWDGAWTKIATPVAPPARTQSVLVYDPLRRASVLFGGANDTWQYDGTWTQILTSGGPVLAAAGAFDPVRGGVITVLPDGKTLLFDGMAWTAQDLAAPAPARFSPGMALDPQRGRPVLVGGRTPDGSFTQDQWELDDDGWHPIAFSGQWSARYNPLLAPRPDGPGLMMFGGVVAAGTDGETWLFQYR